MQEKVTDDLASRKLFLDLLWMISSGAEEDERNVMLEVLQGKSFRQIANPLWSEQEISETFHAALTHCRERGYTRQIDAYVHDQGFSKLLKLLHYLLQGGTPRAMPLTSCPRHGWTVITGMPQCPECPCRIPYTGPAGRRRSYCSNACKQRAYRHRRARTAAEP
ncbi:hypothetical protein [Nocardia brasiliensis]|uniref:hypothetical protein n=1 Tax=Nocardia brasiliensis TaxID=37326 RepID=UPI00366E67B4